MSAGRNSSASLVISNLNRQKHKRLCDSDCVNRINRVVDYQTTGHQTLRTDRWHRAADDTVIRSTQDVVKTVFEYNVLWSKDFSKKKNPWGSETFLIKVLVTVTFFLLHCQLRMGRKHDELIKETILWAVVYSENVQVLWACISLQSVYLCIIWNIWLNSQHTLRAAVSALFLFMLQYRLNWRLFHYITVVFCINNLGWQGRLCNSKW